MAFTVLTNISYLLIIYAEDYTSSEYIYNIYNYTYIIIWYMYVIYIHIHNFRWLDNMIPHSSFLLYLFLSPSLTTDPLLPSFPLRSHTPCYPPITTISVLHPFATVSLFSWFLQLFQVTYSHLNIWCWESQMKKNRQFLYFWVLITSFNMIDHF